MTRFKRECKSALSTVLTVMMVLSMLMGVFSLSASADGEQVYPEILNKPVLVYADKTEYDKSKNDYSYDEIRSDRPWDNLSTISIRLDDTNSTNKVSNISNVTYTYKDADIGADFTYNARYTRAERFGLLLVATDINNKVSNIIEGRYSNQSYSYFNENNYRTSFEGYKKYIESLGRCELTITIYYNDGSEQPISVGVLDDDTLPLRSTGMETAGSILVKLAHSKEIENQDFYELSNAIVAVQSSNDDTTNKYYVDLDSEENISIPMNEMSDYVELVQTRIGNNIIYNTDRSVNFGKNAIPAVSKGEVDYNGHVYHLPNGTYASDDDPFDLLNYISSVNSNSSNNYTNRWRTDFGILDNELVYISPYWWSETAQTWNLYMEKFPDFVERGYLIKNSNATIDPTSSNNYYVGLPDTEYSLDVIHRQTSYYNNNSSYYARFQVSFEDESNEKSLVFAQKLRDRYNSDTISSNVRRYMQQYPFCVYLSGKNSTGYSTYGGNNLSSLIDTLNYGYGWTDPFIGRVTFNAYNFNTGSYKLYPDQYCYELLDLILDVAEEAGLTIVPDECYMPDISRMREDDGSSGGTDGIHSVNPDDYEIISFMDLLQELGITVEQGQMKKVMTYSGNWNRYEYSGDFYDNQFEEHKDYELVQYGKMVIDTGNNDYPVDTECYVLDEEGNKEITFPISRIRNNIQKGVSYNVVNQVQLAKIRTFNTYSVNWNSSDLYYRNTIANDMYYLGNSFPDASGKRTMFNRGKVFYLGGEFIVSSNTVSAEGDMYGNYWKDFYNGGREHNVRNQENGIVRNTEYKWGEIVFASKPDAVTEFAYDTDKQILTWTKPVDEGMGIDSKGKTIKDDTVKIDEYIVTFADENGKVLNTKSVVPSKDPQLNVNGIVKSGVYNISVVAKNTLGESEKTEIKNVILDLADMDVTMTPDQPIHEPEDTITFTETITNTGRVPLTNIIVYQSALGKYEPQDGMTTKGTKASIAELGIGETFTIIYRVNASTAVNNIVTNTIQVNNAQNVNETATASVVINNPDLAVEVVSNKTEYTEDETAVMTASVTNTGNKKFDNITITPDITGGTFTQYDTNICSISDDGNSAVISALAPGEAVSFTYEIPAKDVETDKKGAASVTWSAKTNDAAAAGITEFKVIKPGLTIKATVEETEYGFDQDVVYTVLISNTGNTTQNNVTVSSNVKGEFTENEAGTITDKGDFIIDELSAGKSVSLTYTVKAENTSFGKLTNTFVAKNVDREEKDSVDINIVRYGIDVMKVVDNGIHYLGEDIQFRTIVTNTGNAELKNVVVTEDSEGRFDLSDGAVIRKDNTIVIASIMPGESYTYDYYIAAAKDNIKDGMLSSTSSAEAKSLEKKSDSNSVKIYEPSITLTKTVDTSKEYVIGDTVVWTDTITNNGECDLTNIVLSENLTGTFNTKYEKTASTVTIPTLAAGQSETIKFSTVIEAAYLSDHTYNSISSVTTDQNAAANAAASVNVVGPAITVQKSSDKSIYRIGERVLFTEVITNAGDQTLTNVKVEENLEGKFMKVDKAYTVDGKVLTIPEIAVGDSVVVQYAIDRTLIDTDMVTSRVTVTCDQGASDDSELSVLLETEADTSTDTSSDSTDESSDKTNTDSTDDSSDKTNTDSTDDSSDKTNTDSTDDSSDKTNTDSTDDSSDKTNTDSTDDSSEKTNTDSTDDSSDKTNTDSTGDSSDKTNTDSTDDSSDKTNTDSTGDSSDKTNTDSTGDSSDKTNTDSTDDSGTDTSTDTSSDKKESEDEPLKLMMGDVDMDGKVTSKDALLIQRYTIGIDKFIDVQKLLGDVNGDGKVSAADGMIILRWTIKLPTKSTTGEMVEIPKDMLSLVKK